MDISPTPLLFFCRVVRIDVSSPKASWSDLVPQHERDVLQSAVALKGDHLVVRWGGQLGGMGGGVKGDEQDVLQSTASSRVKRDRLVLSGGGSRGGRQWGWKERREKKGMVDVGPCVVRHPSPVHADYTGRFLLPVLHVLHVLHVL